MEDVDLIIDVDYTLAIILISTAETVRLIRPTNYFLIVLASCID